MEKTESEIILKVTTDYPRGQEEFHTHAQFLIQAYRLIGVTIYVESMAGGAILFFHTWDDFEQFHEFSYQIPDDLPLTSDRICAPPTGKPFVVNVDIIQRPPITTLEMVAEIMERAHRRICPELDFALIPPRTIKMQYKTEGHFHMAFEIVKEALGKKLPPAPIIT